MELLGSRSHGEPFGETITFPRRADPPPSASGGVGTFGADASAADIGGDAGSLSLDGTAWHGVLGLTPSDEGEIESLEHLLARLEVDGDLAENGMLLSTLARLRQGLAQIPLGSHPSTPVQIGAGDALLLARVLLRRLR